MLRHITVREPRESAFHLPSVQLEFGNTKVEDISFLRKTGGNRAEITLLGMGHVGLRTALVLAELGWDVSWCR